MKRWLALIAFFICAISCQQTERIDGLSQAVWQALDEGKGSVTDLRHYVEILSVTNRCGLEAEHFPASIDTNDISSRMVFFGGFLQGGPYFQLRQQLTGDEIAHLYKKFKARATHVFQGGDTNDHFQEQGIPTTFFYASDNEDHKFPDSYEVMVLGSEATGTQKPWNHYSSYGVAISREHSEIVFWAVRM